MSRRHCAHRQHANTPKHASATLLTTWRKHVFSASGRCFSVFLAVCLARVKHVCDTVSQSGEELRHFGTPVANSCFPRQDAVSGCFPERVCKTPSRARVSSVANGGAAKLAGHAGEQPAARVTHWCWGTCLDASVRVSGDHLSALTRDPTATRARQKSLRAHWMSSNRMMAAFHATSTYPVGPCRFLSRIILAIPGRASFTRS